MNTIPINVESVRRMRRQHSPEFKTEVILACLRPGMSMAAVALAHGLNANMLRSWVREYEREHGPRANLPVVTPNSRAANAMPSFVPITFKEPAMASPGASPTPPAGPDIRVEVRRGSSAVVVNWPLEGATSCAAWLREWLR